MREEVDYVRPIVRAAAIAVHGCAWMEPGGHTKAT